MDFEELERQGFFRDPATRAPGYKEKVPGKSIVVQTEDGKRFIVTGFFGGKRLVQYYDHEEERFICLPAMGLSLHEIITHSR